jgi:Zn-finger nucleic acid-binding protein
MTQVITCRFCSNEMEHLHFGSVVIDRCPACYAHWFDAKELAAVFSQEGADLSETALSGQLRLPSVCRHCHTKNSDTALACSHCEGRLGYRCPRDGRPMLVSVQNAVEVDVCPLCRGIWLDGEEFELLLENTQRATAERRIPANLERPKHMPVWMKTPATLRSCQVCGTPRLPPELNFHYGVFKCDECFTGTPSTDQMRIKKVAARNKRRYDSRELKLESSFLSKLGDVLNTPIVSSKK